MATSMIQAWVYMRTWLASVGREESGQGLTEYALIIALVAVLIIGAVLALSGSLNGVFTAVSNCLGGVKSATSSTTSVAGCP